MIRKFALAVLAGALLPAMAHAALTTESIGPRFGFSLDPDQLVVGGQAVMGEIARDVVWSPAIELGVGDHQTNIAVNVDFDYRFRLSDTDWRPYAGFGLGIDFASFDRRGVDDSETNVGGNFVLGATVPTGRNNNSFFGELRLGLGDLPSMKIVAGLHFPTHR
jgi:hypothetical protein